MAGRPPLQMTIRSVTLRAGRALVECERDNGPIQGKLILTMPLMDALDLRPEDTLTLVYSKD